VLQTAPLCEATHSSYALDGRKGGDRSHCRFRQLNREKEQRLLILRQCEMVELSGFEYSDTFPQRGSVAQPRHLNCGSMQAKLNSRHVGTLGTGI